MKKLNLKLIRDIKGAKGQFINIAIVIAIGAFLFTGFSTFSKNLSEYANEYYTRSNLADLTVYYSEISSDNLDFLQGIEGVEEIEGRYVKFGNQKFPNLTTRLKVHSISEDSNINKVTLLDGELPRNNQILIDGDYANVHEYKIGDIVTIGLDINNHEFEISGICESSEYIIKSRNTSDFPPNHEEYGIAYVNVETMDKLIGKQVFNEVLISVDEYADIEKIEEEIELRSEGKSYLYVLKKDFQLSYKQFIGEIKQQGELAKILPIIFFGVAAIITFLAVSRIIDIQRRQIGIMKAMGIKNISIIGHFMGYSIIVGVLGGITGSIMGTMLFPRIFMAQVKAIMSMPNFELKIYGVYIVQGVVFSMIFGVIASFLSCKVVLKEKPSEMMRAKLQKSVKKTMIERNVKLWEKLSYGGKLIVRNIFINKKRSLYSSLGIVSCVAFLILAFGYKGSRALLIDKQFNEVYKYDLRVVFKEESEIDKIFDLKDESIKFNTVAETGVIVTNVKDSKDSNLIVTNKESNFINNYDSKGNLSELDNEGVIISERFAEKYNLAIGDNIELKFLNPKYNGAKIEVKISDISVQYLNQEIFCTPNLLDKFNIQCRPNIMLLKINDVDKISNIYNDYSINDNVKEIKYKHEVKKATEGGLQNLYNMIIVIILSSIAMSFTAIYNISKINITERERELATLKVLGYKKKSINKLIFTENIFITLFGIIIGTPIGIILYKAIIKKFTLDNMVFPINVSLDSIIQPALITLIVTLICNLLLMKDVKNINMIEALKSYD